jgi:hypothetical protein
MKVLAIIDVAKGAPIEAVRAALADELRGSWSPFTHWSVRFAT